MFEKYFWWGAGCFSYGFAFIFFLIMIKTIMDYDPRNSFFIIGISFLIIMYLLSIIFSVVAFNAYDITVLKEKVK